MAHSPGPKSPCPPGVAAALEYLKKVAADPAWKARGELPGVRALARLSGFSHYTLWKALRRAAEAKLLMVTPGKRPRLPGHAHARLANRQETGLRKWERVRQAIERDLLRGAFAYGATPSLKEMQGKYQACYATLRKALRALERTGHWPPVPPHDRSGGDRPYVVYLAWGEENGNMHFDEPFDHEYLKALRSACESLNLESAVVVYGYRNDVIRLVMPPGAKLGFPALCRKAVGFVVRTACPRDVCTDLLPQLARHRKPVAVIDEIQSPSLPDLARRNRLIRSFRPTISEASGEIMARHLLSRGHRRVAMISPFRDAVWSRNRFAGLAATLKGADPEATAVEYSVAMPYHQRHEVREDRAFGLLRRSLLGTTGWKAPLPSLKGLATQLEREIHLAVRRERLLEALTPRLEAALAREDLTAWVAADDDTALLILEFMERRGLQVPRDISLVGFDDTAEGARRDLTSYNFNFERFNHYVLRYLLEPMRVVRSEGQGTRSPEGTVIARGSVQARH